MSSGGFSTVMSIYWTVRISRREFQKIFFPTSRSFLKRRFLFPSYFENEIFKNCIQNELKSTDTKQIKFVVFLSIIKTAFRAKRFVFYQ